MLWAHSSSPKSHARDWSVIQAANINVVPGTRLRTDGGHCDLQDVDAGRRAPPAGEGSLPIACSPESQL